jgi:hypothetical protein
MAKGKALLTESEVRKFMKFANIPHLAENFFKEEMYAEEEVMEEEPPADDMGDMPAEEPVAEEPPADMDMGGEAGGLEAEAERVLGDLAALLSKAGVPVSVAGDMPAEEPPADDMGDEVAELDEMGAYDEEALAESVLKRVMARVKKLTESKQRKAKLANRVDEVTNRIMKRIVG